MNDNLIQDNKRLPLKMFRSPLLFVIEAIFIISAIFMVISMVRFLDPAHRRDVIYGLVAQQITDPAALETWFGIIVAGKALFTLYSVGMAVGFGRFLITAATCQDDTGKIKGLGFIAVVNRIAIWSWGGLLSVSAVVFVVKMITYITVLVSEEVDFIFPLMAVLAGEAVMVLLLVGITVFLIVMWREHAFLCDHLRYMLYTGRVDSHIESFCSVSLYFIAALCSYLVVFFAYDPISIIAFALLAVASVMLGVCIRILKSRVEHIKFQAYLEKRAEKKK